MIWCLQSDVTVRPILAFRFDNWVTVVFTLVIAIWSMFMLDVWTRTLRTYQTRWGLDSKFESNHRTRGKFRGNKTLHPRPIRQLGWESLEARFLDAAHTAADSPEREIQYDTLGLTLKRCVAVFLPLVTMTAMLVIVYVAITVFRVFARIKLSADHDSDLIGSLLASLTASLLNLIFILALNDVYYIVAIKLTDWENHRTQSGHEDALIWRVFWFQFVNTNAALFYVAVIKPSYESIRCSSGEIIPENPWPEPCASYGCRLELSLELMVIMVGKQWLQNKKEAYYPKLETWWTNYRAKSKDKEAAAYEDLEGPMLRHMFFDM